MKGMKLMTIELSAAEKISSLTVFGFGMALVFVGLIFIIIICFVLGALLKARNTETAPASPAGDTDIPNRGEFIAAVASAIAEDLGADVKGIRILSVKKI